MRRLKIPTSCCGLLGVAAMVVASAVAAPGDKTIEVETQHRSDPVAITRIMFGSSEVQCGLITSPTSSQPVVPISAGDDWLDGLIISVLNRTNKTITLAQFNFFFPETGDGTKQGAIRVGTITLGQPPIGSTVPSGSSFHFAWAPNQVIQINVADYSAQMKRNVERQMPFGLITKCTIHRTVVYFDDGMKWNGRYFAPDPSHPGQMTILDGMYFPGVPVWPPPRQN